MFGVVSAVGSGAGMDIRLVAAGAIGELSADIVSDPLALHPFVSF